MLELEPAAFAEICPPLRPVALNHGFARAVVEGMAPGRVWVDTRIDAGAAHAEAGVEYAEAQRDIVELRTIAQVLSRIDEGSYGTCADCGADIPAARLRAQPSAAHSPADIDEALATFETVGRKLGMCGGKAGHGRRS